MTRGGPTGTANKVIGASLDGKRGASKADSSLPAGCGSALTRFSYLRWPSHGPLEHPQGRRNHPTARPPLNLAASHLQEMQSFHLQEVIRRLRRGVREMHAGSQAARLLDRAAATRLAKAKSRHGFSFPEIGLEVGRRAEATARGTRAPKADRVVEMQSFPEARGPGSQNSRSQGPRGEETRCFGA